MDYIQLYRLLEGGFCSYLSSNPRSLRIKILLPSLFLSLALTGVVLAQSLEVTVAKVEGDVEVRMPDSLEWRTASPGMRLPEGVEIRTGPSSRADLVFADNSVGLVESFSDLTVDKFARSGQTTVTRIDLRVGKIAATVREGNPTVNDFKVSTPTSVASVRGTKIERITAGGLFGDNLQMGDRGKVKVSAQEGKQKGQSLVVTKGEATDTHLTPPAEIVRKDTTLVDPPKGSTEKEKELAINNPSKANIQTADLGGSGDPIATGESNETQSLPSGTGVLGGGAALASALVNPLGNTSRPDHDSGVNIADIALRTPARKEVISQLARASKFELLGSGLDIEKKAVKSGEAPNQAGRTLAGAISDVISGGAGQSLDEALNLADNVITRGQSLQFARDTFVEVMNNTAGAPATTDEAFNLVDTLLDRGEGFQAARDAIPLGATLLARGNDVSTSANTIDQISALMANNPQSKDEGFDFAKELFEQNFSFSNIQNYISQVLNQYQQNAENTFNNIISSIGTGQSPTTVLNTFLPPAGGGGGGASAAFLSDNFESGAISLERWETNGVHESVVNNHGPSVLPAGGNFMASVLQTPLTGTPGRLGPILSLPATVDLRLNISFKTNFLAGGTNAQRQTLKNSTNHYGWSLVNFDNGATGFQGFGIPYYPSKLLAWDSLKGSTLTPVSGVPFSEFGSTEAGQTNWRTENVSVTVPTNIANSTLRFNNDTTGTDASIGGLTSLEAGFLLDDVVITRSDIDHATALTGMPTLFRDNFERGRVMTGDVWTWDTSANVEVLNNLGTTNPSEGSLMALLKTETNNTSPYNFTKGYLKRWLGSAATRADTNLNVQFDYNFLAGGTAAQRLQMSDGGSDDVEHWFEAKLNINAPTLPFPDIEIPIAQASLSSSSLTSVTGLPSDKLNSTEGGQTGWQGVNKDVLIPSGSSVQLELAVDKNFSGSLIPDELKLLEVAVLMDDVFVDQLHVEVAAQGIDPSIWYPLFDENFETGRINQNRWVTQNAEVLKSLGPIGPPPGGGSGMAMIRALDSTNPGLLSADFGISTASGSLNASFWYNFIYHPDTPEQIFSANVVVGGVGNPLARLSSTTPYMGSIVNGLPISKLGRNWGYQTGWQRASREVDIPAGASTQLEFRVTKGGTPTDPHPAVLLDNIVVRQSTSLVD